MSRYTEILADIKTRLESVQNAGRVHDYARWSPDQARFLQFFSYRPPGGEQQVRGWEITRTSASEHIQGAYFRHHVFVLTGYMGLRDADATDKKFQELVEAVCDRFRSAQPPAGSAWDYRDGDDPDNSPVQVDTIELRMFGNVLCHYAEIRLSVTERIVV